MPVDIWGEGALAQATVRAARFLSWDLGPGGDVIAVAPLAPSVAACDAVIARPVVGTRAFVWPMVGVTAVQQMIGRCGHIGALTNLSSRATRPRSTLLLAAHDQVALLLLVAQINGHGVPSDVSSRPLTDDTVRLTMRFDGGRHDPFTATVDVTWDDVATPSLDVQVAGADGVLRIDTDPSTHLEHNGEPVALPSPTQIAAELQPLRDSGVIDVLKTIGASFAGDGRLAHAFSFEFGRSVVAIVESAQSAGGPDGQQNLANPCT